MDIPLEVRAAGLYCTSGDFYIDAWKPVDTCVVTHAHSDHARWGHKRYICSSDSKELLLYRLGDVPVQALPYGEKIKLGSCWVSLHPAGHILGSSQIRIETPDQVVVVSGDYKRMHDGTCAPFEVVECDVFISESTFGLPIYHWEESEVIAAQIMAWWQENKALGHPSVLFCYSLGKAQRILSLLSSHTDQAVFLHGAIHPLTDIYAKKGIHMLSTKLVNEQEPAYSFGEDLILAPPSAAGSLWLRRFSQFRTAAASGWMQVRGTRKRKNMDRGFVLSDHADWNALIRTVVESKASHVLTTHGSTSIVARYLSEHLFVKAGELTGLETNEEFTD